MENQTDETKTNVPEYTEIREYTEKETPERRPSPFAYHDGMYLEFERYRKKTAEKITSMIEKRLIRNDDRQLLSLLSSYRYLNSHLAFLAFSVFRECEEEYIKNRLSELFRLGLVSRFRIHYADETGKNRSLSYVYCLSEKGRGLAGSTDDDVHTATDVIARLSYNQYYIMMKTKYGGRLYTHRYSYSPTGEDREGLLVFASNKRNLCFNVFSIRADNDKFAKLGKEFTKFEKDRNAAFIILAESEPSALELETYRMSVPEYAGYVVLYMCDYASFDGTLLSNLVRVTNAEAGAYSTISLQVDA